MSNATKATTNNKCGALSFTLSYYQRVNSPSAMCSRRETSIRVRETNMPSPFLSLIPYILPTVRSISYIGSNRKQRPRYEIHELSILRSLGGSMKLASECVFTCVCADVLPLFNHQSGCFRQHVNWLATYYTSV